MLERAGVLAPCQARARERRLAKEKHGGPAGRVASEGYSSADSAGDEESIEPMLVDPDVDLLDIIEDSIP